MFCFSCGQQVKKGAGYCRHCGTPVWQAPGAPAQPTGRRGRIAAARGRLSPRLLWGVIGGFVVIALALGLGLGLGLGLRSAVAVDSNLVNRWVDDNLHAVWQFDADGTLTVEGQDGQLLARGSYRTQNVGPGNVGPGRDSILSIRGDELLRLLTWSAFEYGSVVGSANLALFPVDEPTGRLFLTREDRYYPGD